MRGHQKRAILQLGTFVTDVAKIYTTTASGQAACDKADISWTTPDEVHALGPEWNTNSRNEEVPKPRSYHDQAYERSEASKSMLYNEVEADLVIWHKVYMDKGTGSTYFSDQTETQFRSILTWSI